MAKQPIEGTRSNMFWRDPESLIILGYDKHAASPLLDALGQDERPLGQVHVLREIAEAWNAGEEAQARALAEEHGGAWLVDDACLALNIAATRIHEPVLVTRDGDDVIVVDGRRRVVAARVADAISCLCSVADTTISVALHAWRNSVTASTPDAPGRPRSSRIRSTWSWRTS